MEPLTPSDGVTIRDIFSSVILLATLLSLRKLLMRSLARTETLTIETRRRWALTIRNAAVLIFVVGLLFIWGHELQAFAVSLLAIAVAVVLATKELILCVSGSVLRAGTNAYTVGDRIQLGESRGNVVDHNWLATTLLEVGPGSTANHYTGRAVIVPNSLLLSQPVINETFLKPYLFHIIAVPLHHDDDWCKAESILIEAARSESATYLAEAQHHIQSLAGKVWLDLPSVEPRVTIQLPEPDTVQLLLRMPVPAQHALHIEQAVLRRFLQAYPRDARPRQLN